MRPMTFKEATRIFDRLPAGDQRAELQKALGIFRRVIEYADLKDLVAIDQEMISLGLVASGFSKILEEREKGLRR